MIITFLRFSLPLFLIFVALTSCEGTNTETETNNEENKLEGLWTLHIMELQDSVTGQWNEWRGGMQGYLLYDATENMSLHLLTKDYEKTDLVFPNFTDTIPLAALKHLTNSYVYFGKYKIDKDERIVEHDRISHSNPKDWGKVVQRRYSFSGDTLILRPVEETNAGLRLKWLKKRTNKHSQD